MFNLETRTGDPIAAGGVQLVSIARSMRLTFGHGAVIWNRPIGRVEIVSNGKVVKRFDPNGDRRAVKETFDWTPSHGGWVVARVFGAQQQPIRFAHTSPIYIEMPGRPFDPSEDAAYFSKWIGRRVEGLNEDSNFDADWQREAVRRQLKQAEAVYRGLLSE